MQYPEAAAGGFTRLDGNVEFYGRVQALLAERTGPVTVVDFGAGRGLVAEDEVLYRRLLAEFRGPDRTVIGVDVDPVVVDNPRLDEGRVIDPSGTIPLDDASVDLVVSDFTFEHVDNPDVTARELDRILKPGGWICARTPNKWGYIAIGARLVPNRLHVSALHKLQPAKHDHDTFPTRYLMNTRSALERWFPEPRFTVHAYTMDAESHLYAGSSRVLRLGLGLARHLPGPAKSMWMVFVHKADA